MTGDKAIDHCTEQLLKSLRSKASVENAPAMKAYMKHRFDFLGVQAGPRRQVFRAWAREADQFPAAQLALALWSYPFREMQYCAIDLLIHRDKKPVAQRIELYEHLICTHSWWDSVDPIASKLVGRFFMQRPELQQRFIDKCLKSDSIWLQRTCLIFQLHYKEHTDVNALERCISALRQSDEFFIQKAIGWALRNYARQDPQWVCNLVSRMPLAPLSRREALKHL